MGFFSFRDSSGKKKPLALHIATSFILICCYGFLIGMEKKKVALCFALALMLVEVRAGFKQSLNTIKAKMASVGRNVNAKVKTIENALNSEKNKAIADAASTAIDKMAGAVGSLTKSDILDIVSGCLEMTSAITSMIPVVGTVVSAVFGLISSILGAIGGGDDVGTIVRREIKKSVG